MAADLLRVGLQRLQDRFSKASEVGRKLQGCLIEWPALGGKPQNDPPEFSGQTWVWHALGGYRPAGVVRDENGCPTFSDKLTYDRDGKPIANTAGQPYAYDRGACRAIQLYGTYEARDALKPILVAAGTLLAGTPADGFPVSIPPATLREGDPLRRWLYLLFDLAWAKIAGSPLRVSVDKSAWHESTSVTLETVLLYRGSLQPFGPIEAMLANIPDPPTWYSVLDDVAQASVHALDILLTRMAQSPAVTGGVGKATDTDAPPAAKTEQGEGEGDKDTAPKKRKARRKRSDPKADAKIADAYNTGSYRTEAALAAALGMTALEVHRARDRHRQREVAKARGRKNPRQ